MAYDEELADRVREIVAEGRDVTEQRMFGGLAFLIGGHMAVAASGEGGLLVRVDPASSDALIAKGDATPMVMQGRAMTGWLRVDAAKVRTERQLRTWIERGTAYVATLPPKPPKKPKAPKPPR